MKVATTTRRNHGQREFLLEYDQEAVVQPDVSWLVRILEEAAESGTVYGGGESLRIGWVDLEVGDTEGDYLTLLEPDWTGAVPWRLVRSVTKALVHLRRQTDVAESLGLSDQVNFPNVLDSGIICSALSTRACGVMDRVEPNERDSGWFLGCDDPQHDHNDPGQLRRESLYAIACAAPGVAQFCALPPEISITFGGPERVTVRMSGEVTRISPGSYLDELRTAT